MSNGGNLSGFDAKAVEPSSFDALPAGEYPVCIVESAMEPTSKGDGGKFLRLVLQVLNGEFQNRRLTERLNLVNSNAKAVEIAKGTLSAICRAVGVLTPNDSSDLHNKPMRVKVKIEKTADYGEQNRITAYKPLNAGPAAAPAAPPVASTPYSEPVQPVAAAPWPPTDAADPF